MAITNTIASTFPLLIYIPTHDYVYSSRLHGNYVGHNVSVPPNYICSYIHFHGIHTTLSSPTRQAGRQASRQTGQARVDERAQVHDKIKERVFVRSFVPLSMLCSTNLLLLPPTILKLFLCKDFDSSTRGKESVADM